LDVTSRPSFKRATLGIAEEKRMDASYFNRPLQESMYFRTLTGLMLLALGFGGYATIRYWTVFPIFVRVWLTAILAELLIMWAKGIRSHRRFQNLLAKTPQDEFAKEVVKLSGILHYAGQSQLYAVTLLLFMTLLIVIVHFEKLLTKISS
jgi:hypothetical protein